MNTAEGLIDQALILLKDGQLERAGKLYQRVIALEPKNVKAQSNLGVIYKLQGRLDLAEKQFRKVLRLDPKLALVYSNLANIYRIKGDIRKAEKFCRKAIHLDGKFADAYNNLGAILQFLGKPQEAIKNYKRAVQLAPTFDDAYINLAGVLNSLGRYDEAINLCRKAIKLDFQNPDPYYNLGNIFKNKGKLSQAIIAYEKVIELNPDFSDAYDQLIDVLKQLCEWQKLKKYTSKLDEMTDLSLSKNKMNGETPFNAIIGHDDPERNLKIAKSWATNIEHSIKTSPFNFTKVSAKKKRLRIGYVSGDFTDHPVGHIMKSMFGKHDRKRFEVFAYSFGPPVGGLAKQNASARGVRRQIQRGCDVFRDIDRLSFQESAQQIYKDKIDILVDLMGYTNGNRLEIFARRPAPIQVSYLGFPGSMGAKFIDYAIVDKVLVGEGEQKYYSEKLVYTSGSYQVNDSEQKISSKNVKRSDFKLPKEATVFASFNRVSKITPDMFGSWMRILKAVPGSVLWLPQSIPEAQENLRKEAKIRRIDPKRLMFGKILQLENHLGRLRLADIMLDTYPYSGGATTSHALRMGVPVVTLKGKTYVSRMSASLLHAVGMDELVCTTCAQYEKLAITLGKSPKKCEELKAKLKENLTKTHLYDTALFVRNLEKIYEQMWSTYFA